MTLEVEKIRARPGNKPTLDSKGFFIIMLDREKEEIIVEHYENVQKGGGTTVSGRLSHVYVGTDAESLCSTILSKGVVSMLDHAAYMGRELQRAETALKQGLEYAQDEGC